MCSFYVVGAAFMGLHYCVFTKLNGKPVNETMNQGLSTALANILAIFVGVSLLGGLGVAYDQILRRLLRQKTLTDDLIDKLGTLDSSPWNLFRGRILKQIFRVKRLWLIGLLCAGIPIAAVFPPGALTVSFKMHDYGNGTHRQFVEKSFFEMNGDFSYQDRLRPSLNALASQVLASGGPVNIASPCSSSCVYNISIEGPRFHRKERRRGDSLMKKCSSIIYTAEDQKDRSSQEPYSRTNNSFKISWLPKPSKCEIKTLDCSMTLATYGLEINNSPDSFQSITVNHENDREIWDEDRWIQTQFYYYFFDRDGKPNAVATENLHINFTNAQAFAVSRAAVNALQGEVEMINDGFNEQTVIFFSGNASQVLGSPYIGLSDRYNAEFNISAESIERYLQDVVVSTISLNMSTYNRDVIALTGADVYEFSEKAQFFAGYGACLVVAGFISLFGCLSLNWNREA
ncbi:oleate hydratase [Fusarium mundagurra]|uniref:Oleate hydratase n=1 Tax=Fusarium mundagurra TaxID=1567541 RepID=A0A8H5Y111_9HYPO|nr:oleate hydratase [Fusarium mundagurra]